MTPESSTKRKREEDVSSISLPNGESSPKKVKTDWDGPVSEELAKKKQELEAAGQTDEDAAKFLENMTEMLAMATSEGKSVPPEVSDTLDQILNGYLDKIPAVSSFADSLVRGSSPSLPAAGDGLLEFFRLHAIQRR